MPLILASLFWLMAHAFANVNTISIKGLNLDYQTPHGKGELEKFKIGFNFDEPQGPYPVEVHRTGTGMVFQSPNVEVTWEKPGATIHNAQRVQTRNFNLELGSGPAHLISAETLLMQPEGGGEFLATAPSFKCTAKSPTRQIDRRLMEDCMVDLELKVKRVEIPDDFFLVDIAKELPQIFVPEDELPGDDLFAQSKNGDVYAEISLKYWIRAKLRFWGHAQYEDNFETVAIRIDQVKYGVLPVTSIVMKVLKDRIKNPSVKVDPPWVRISLK